MNLLGGLQEATLFFQLQHLVRNKGVINNTVGSPGCDKDCKDRLCVLSRTIENANTMLSITIVNIDAPQALAYSDNLPDFTGLRNHRRVSESTSSIVMQDGVCLFSHFPPWLPLFISKNNKWKNSRSLSFLFLPSPNGFSSGIQRRKQKGVNRKAPDVSHSPGCRGNTSTDWCNRGG